MPPPQCPMCWSIFSSKHLRSPAGVGKMWWFHWPLGLCSYTGSTSPPICSSALPLPATCPASHLLIRNPSVGIRPSTSPTLLCDSPLLPLLPTFQKCADIFVCCHLLFSQTLWVCNSFYSFIVCVRVLWGSRQRFMRGSSATFNQKFFGGPFSLQSTRREQFLGLVLK